MAKKCISTGEGPIISRRKIDIKKSQSNAGGGLQRPRKRRVSFVLLISFLISHLQGLRKK